MASLGKALSKFAASLTAEDIMGLAMMAGGLSAIRGASSPVSSAVGGMGGASAIDHNVEQKMPQNGLDVNYQVNWIPGAPQHNARLDRSKSEAAYMQSEAEHNEALTYFLKRLPRNATVAQVNEAIRKGVMKERELRKFWAGNRTLREYISPSSSAVSMIKIDPSNNIIVRFGNNPTNYTYRGGANPYESSKIAAQLALAPSIGQAVNGWWGQTYGIPEMRRKR